MKCYAIATEVLLIMASEEPLKRWRYTTGSRKKAVSVDTVNRHSRQTRGPVSKARGRETHKRAGSTRASSGEKKCS